MKPLNKPAPNYLRKEAMDKKTKQIKEYGVSELLATTAHDFRSIVGGIYGLTQILEEKLKENPDPEIRELNGLIASQCELGIDISTGLVQDYKQAICSLKELLTAQAHLYKYQAARKNITLTTHFPVRDIYVQTKPGLLIRVLDNLVNNGIKFTPRQGQIILGLKLHDKKVIISVTDTGIGIPADFYPLIFNKLPQIQRPGTENEPSTGLGLYISKQLTDELRGNLWFRSAENKGTTFYLSLSTYTPPCI
jgi:two-component system sensor histidine kinase VicK